MATQYIAAKEFTFNNKKYSICDRVPVTVVNERLKKLGLVVKSSELEVIFENTDDIKLFANLSEIVKESSAKIISLEEKVETLIKKVQLLESKV